MRRAYDVPAVRAAEDSVLAALPDGALMQRAAAGLAAVCASVLGRVYGARVLLLVGPGNNGGDALFAGARLAARGARVDALLLADAPHAEGLAALLRAGGRTTTAAAGAELVIDGIVGIGGSGPLRGAAAAAADALEDGPLVVAVDVPSGVDARTGEVAGPAVRADVTVTFGALKPGLVIDPGASYAGAVELVDIGLGPHLPVDQAVELLQAADVAAMLPRPDRESDKYRRGVVGVAAGSEQYTGAAVLCVGAAVRGGAGMVRYIGTEGPASLVRQRWPEVVVGKGRVQAWTVGSGGGGSAAEHLATAFESGVATVVDADALPALAALAGSAPPCLLTPHEGELAGLVGADRHAVEDRRLEHARAAAQQLGHVVLLKGSTTVIAAPSGRVRVNPTGTPALATAGSGDVLAGLCGALLAGGLDPFDAGSVAAWLHGLAGRLASDGGARISAYDVLDALPRAFQALEN